MDSVGNVQDAVGPSGPIEASGWLQNSVCSRKRQDRKDWIYVEIQTDEPNYGPAGYWIKDDAHLGKQACKKLLAVKPVSKMVVWIM